MEHRAKFKYVGYLETYHGLGAKQTEEPPETGRRTKMNWEASVRGMLCPLLQNSRDLSRGLVASVIRLL
jgi:hypothetical protein